MFPRLVWRYLRHHLGAVAAVVTLQILGALAGLVLPTLNADIIDHGIATGNTGYIWRLGAAMLAISALQLVSTIGATYISATTAMGLGRYLRRTLFRHVQRFGSTELHRFGAPTLITRATNDVQGIQMVLLFSLIIIVVAPITGIGGIVMAIHQDVALSGLLLVIVPALALVVWLCIRAMTPLYEIQQKLYDRINTRLREQLSGARVIRAFVRQNTERTKYTAINTDLRSTTLKIGTIWAIMMPAAQFIIGVSCAAVIWFGGMRIEAGGIQVGVLVAYISYLMAILMAIMMSGMMMMFYPRGEVSAGRVLEVLDIEPSITAPSQPAHLPEESLTIELDDVALHYEGAATGVLDGITLTLRPGTTTAVIGATGSGKTSLAHLFPRLIDATSGQVRAGGIPVTDLDPDELRSRIALVPQAAYLFSGTIATTVGGTHPDRERVRTALEGAGAWEFVSELANDIDAPVEAGGANFSGGQRQRLTIARALYAALDPTRHIDLVIFDDSFSALDYATDAAIRAHLRTYVGNAAVLIVAQRVATIRNAGTIVVLDGGHIAASGTHNELAASSPIYQEIISSQVEKEVEA